MKWSEFFTSSVGKKFVMALSGLFLVSFLVVHVGINLCIFADVLDDNDNGEIFIEDQGSTNGSYLNGKRITGMHLVRPQDEVKVGTSLLHIKAKSA